MLHEFSKCTQIDGEHEINVIFKEEKYKYVHTSSRYHMRDTICQKAKQSKPKFLRKLSNEF